MLARTPAKTCDAMEKQKTPPTKIQARSSPPKTQTLTTNVRRSIEKLEGSGTEPQNLTPATSKTEAHVIPRQVLSNRTAEARASLIKARTNIGNSKNIRNDIKANVLEAVEKLFQLVKDAEAEVKRLKKTGDTSASPPRLATPEATTLGETGEDPIIKQLQEQSRLLIENGKKLDELKDKIGQQTSNARTYAETTAVRSTLHQPQQSALHSVVVTSKDENDTGDQVLTKVREAVNAKEGWIRVERTRKGRDRKVIMSCQTEEDRVKVKQRLEKSGKNLIVEEVKNRDPLLRLADVLSVNTDEEVLKAFRRQNQGLFHDIKEDEIRVAIKYKRKARNPHTNHVILCVSPVIWRRAMDSGAVYIDLQRIRVFDQSPLVQCSRCLGYGHSRKYCVGDADLCSHCGGPHLRAQCSEWLSGREPTCRNCTAADLDRNDHNAFSSECPIRRKRDAIARMSVAYC